MGACLCLCGMYERLSNSSARLSLKIFPPIEYMLQCNSYLFIPYLVSWFYLRNRSHQLLYIFVLVHHQKEKHFCRYKYAEHIVVGQYYDIFATIVSLFTIFIFSFPFAGISLADHRAVYRSITFQCTTARFILYDPFLSCSAANTCVRFFEREIRSTTTKKNSKRLN